MQQKSVYVRKKKIQEKLIWSGMRTNICGSGNFSCIEKSISWKQEREIQRTINQIVVFKWQWFESNLFNNTLLHRKIIQYPNWYIFL